MHTSLHTLCYFPSPSFPVCSFFFTRLIFFLKTLVRNSSYLLFSPSEAWKAAVRAFSLSCSLAMSLLFISSCSLHSPSFDCEWSEEGSVRTTITAGPVLCLHSFLANNDFQATSVWQQTLHSYCSYVWKKWIVNLSHISDKIFMLQVCFQVFFLSI